MSKKKDKPKVIPIDFFKQVGREGGKKYAEQFKQLSPEGKQRRLAPMKEGWRRYIEQKKAQPLDK